MKRKLRICFVIIWLAMIFAFSAQPDVRSYQVSGSVSYRLVNLYDHLLQVGLAPEEMEALALQIDYPVRKAAHMSEYAVLSLLVLTLLSAYSKQNPDPRKIGRLCFLSLAAVFGFACLDEFHQLFVRGREGKFTDVLIDSAGAAAALTVSALVMYHKYKKRKR